MIKDYKDYIPGLREKFPEIPNKVIEEMLRIGISGMQYLINRDNDIYIETKGAKTAYRLGLIRPKYMFLKRNDRARKNYFRLHDLRKQREDAASY